MNYLVTRVPGFIFTLKQSAVNTGHCAGAYSRDESIAPIHGRPVYSNCSMETFLAFTGRSWCLAAACYLDTLRFKPETFSGNHTGGGVEPDDGEWQDYTVRYLAPAGGPAERGSPKAVALACARDVASWMRLEDYAVPFQTEEHSGDIRTERDLLAAQRRCLSTGCGGFTWKRPHVNSRGQEEASSICSFFRRAQGDLRAAARPTPGFDLHLAPNSFHTDITTDPKQLPEFLPDLSQMSTDAPLSVATHPSATRQMDLGPGSLSHLQNAPCAVTADTACLDASRPVPIEAQSIMAAVPSPAIPSQLERSPAQTTQVKTHPLSVTAVSPQVERSMQEMEAAECVSRAAVSAQEAGEDKAVVSTFRLYDAHGCGIISKERLETVMQMLDSKLTHEDVDYLVSAAGHEPGAGIHKDGTINYECFVTWLYNPD